MAKKKILIQKEIITAKGKHEVLTPHMSICVCLAYRPHTHESGHLSKPKCPGFGTHVGNKAPRSSGLIVMKECNTLISVHPQMAK